MVNYARLLQLSCPRCGCTILPQFQLSPTLPTQCPDCAIVIEPAAWETPPGHPGEVRNNPPGS